MTLKLYAHPFSSYSQKVLIALYENRTPFDFCLLGPDEPAEQDFARLWPLRRMPILSDDARVIRESSVIIEYLGLCHPGPVALLPTDPLLAIEVRFLDRFFDQYVMTPMQKIVADFLRPQVSRDPYGVELARNELERAYEWLEINLPPEVGLVAGAEFTMAECAAAPALFYADWVQPINRQLAKLRAQRQRLLERPSVRRAVDEARPFRRYFPPGAPDRD